PGVDDAVPRVEGDREHRAALPLEGVGLLLIVSPDLGCATAFDHNHDLFIHMALGVEGACARNLNHVAAPLALCSIELDERAIAAHAAPGLERHVLHAANADAAIDRDSLRLHVIVIRRVRPLPGAVARVRPSLRLVPVLARDFVHGPSPRYLGRRIFSGRAALNKPKTSERSRGSIRPAQVQSHSVSCQSPSRPGRRSLMLLFEIPWKALCYYETITRTVEVDFSHKKQIGGGGEYACVRLRKAGPRVLCRLKIAIPATTSAGVAIERAEQSSRQLSNTAPT